MGLDKVCIKFLFLLLFHFKSFQLITGNTNVAKTRGDSRFIECRIGTQILSFLIDSGATVNTITNQEWTLIKRNCRTVVQDLTLHPEEVLSGYANPNSLDVVCSFRAYIGVKNSDQPLELAKFFVVNGTSLSLLGYETSSKLNLIRIGIQTRDQATGNHTINYTAHGKIVNTDSLKEPL